MKNLKKITAVFVFAFLLLGITNASAESKEIKEEKQEILTMRVVETFEGTTRNGSIAIVDENGKSEIIELKKGKKDFWINMVEINNTLNSIIDKGYELIFTSGGGDMYVIVTTYTFVKK